MVILFPLNIPQQVRYRLMSMIKVGVILLLCMLFHKIIVDQILGPMMHLIQTLVNGNILPERLLTVNY